MTLSLKIVLREVRSMDLRPEPDYVLVSYTIEARRDEAPIPPGETINCRCVPVPCSDSFFDYIKSTYEAVDKSAYEAVDATKIRQPPYDFRKHEKKRTPCRSR